MVASNKQIQDDTPLMPRIALAMEDTSLERALSAFLREKYTAILVVNDLEALGRCTYPLIVITDTMPRLRSILQLRAANETQILLISHDEDGESLSAAFEMGATDSLSYPFSAEAEAKLERYLEAFR